MTEAAKRGWLLFQEMGCIGCHTVEREYAQFTNGNFMTRVSATPTAWQSGTEALSVRLAPGVR